MDDLIAGPLTEVIHCITSVKGPEIRSSIQTVTQNGVRGRG